MKPFQLALSLLVLTATVQAETLGPEWAYRRPLTFKHIASDAPGEPVVWAEFYTNGTQRPDGADLRVVNDQRNIVPAKVLQVSPQSDKVRIAFSPRGEGPHFVCWGNPKADKPGPELTVQRGVFCEVFKFPGGATDNEKQVRGCFERAKTLLGSTFLPEIFLGYNPIGYEGDVLCHYRSAIHVSKAASYDFAFSVDSTGFVELDGQLLLARHGNGGMIREARLHKTVTLQPGWHPVDVFQSNTGGGDFGVGLYWRTEADGKYQPVPASVFAPVAEATPGPLEKTGAPYTADFLLAPGGESFSPPDRFLPRYVFTASVPATFSPTFHWDFGDGQTANSRTPHHIFLAPGTYPVTLTVKQGNNTFSTTQRLLVQNRLYDAFPHPAEDPGATAAAILQGYNLAKLNVEARFRGMMLLGRERLTAPYLTWGQAWLEAREAQDESLVWEQTQELFKAYQGQNRFSEAAESYRLASMKPMAMEFRVRAMATYLQTLCDLTEDAATAVSQGETFLKKEDLSKPGVRRVMLAALAYAAVGQGDGKRAEQWAREAGVAGNQPYAQQEIKKGTLARDVETYIRTKDFDTAARLLAQWDADYPLAITEGFTRLLRVKLRMAEGRPAVAGRMAQQFVKAEPGSFYAAELLYRAYEAFQASGQKFKAAAALEDLKKNYPESPYARDNAPKPSFIDPN